MVPRADLLHLRSGSAQRVGAAALLFLAALSVGGRAWAGARPYAFVYGAETLPQTGLELENWFGESRTGGGVSNWNWWMGPVLGVTDHLETAAYAIFDQPPKPNSNQDGSLQLQSFRLQTSYLLADRGAWPIDLNARVEVGVPAASRAVTTWLTLIAAKDIGRLDVTVNASGWLEINKFDGDVDPYLTYRLGSSYQIIPGVRLGAEFIGSTDLGVVEAGGTQTTLTAGPSVAAGYGRLWLSANYGFGLISSSPNQARVIVGLAF